MRGGKLFVSVLLTLLLALLPATALPRVCTTGQPCGDSCIAWSDECHVGGGGGGGQGSRHEAEGGGDVLLAALALVLAFGALIGIVVYCSEEKPADGAGR